MGHCVGVPVDLLLMQVGAQRAVGLVATRDQVPKKSSRVMEPIPAGQQPDAVDPLPKERNPDPMEE